MYTCKDKRDRGFVLKLEVLAFLWILPRTVMSEPNSTEERSGVDLPRGNMWNILRMKDITLNMSSS